MRARLKSLILVGAISSCVGCSGSATSTSGEEVTATGGVKLPASGQASPTQTRRLASPPPVAPARLSLTDAVIPSGLLSAWSKTPNSPGADSISAVAADGAGNFYVAGTLGGSADIGCPTHTPTDATFVNSGYVAKYTAAGACAWAAYVDGNDFVGASAVAVDASGAVFVLGNFAGQTLLNGQIASTGGDIDGFVMKLSPAGAVTWARALGGGGDQYFYALAVNSTKIAVAGAFTGTASFGGGALSSPNADASGFIAEYNNDVTDVATGTFLAQQSFGTTGWSSVNSLAFASGGSLVADGTFAGTAIFGASTFISAGGQDGFIATYDPALAPTAAQQMGGAGDDAAHGIVIGATGNITAAGYFQTSATFTASTTPATPTGTGTHTGFLATYAADLSTVTATTIDSTGDVIPEALSIDGSGGFVVAGHFTGTATFGTTAYPVNGDSNGFVLAYGSGSTFRWATVFGQGIAEGLGVASANGLTVIGGDFTGSVDFGGGNTATSGTGNDSSGLLWALSDVP